MGQEIGWTFSGDKDEKEQGWTFSAPPSPPTGRVVVDKIRSSARGLEVPKRPGALPALGQALKKTGQQVIAPVEGAVRMAAGIPAWMAGTATTVGAQPFVGWEKAGEIGQKVSGALAGGQARLGGEQTASVEEMLSPLAAPFSLALEKGPEALAPGEPATQAMLGAGMGLALILGPKLGITPKTLIRDAKMKVWRDKTIPAKERASVISTLNRAEEAGAKKVGDITEPKPPAPKIKTEVPKGKVDELPPTLRRQPEPPPSPRSVAINEIEKKLNNKEFKFEYDDGSYDFVSRSTDPELKSVYPYRITYFNKEGTPLGHGDVQGIREAAVELHSRKLSKPTELESIAAKIEPRPGGLNLTREQMGMGLEDFNKTQAEAGVLGEPRGGGMLPVRELPKRAGPINLERLDLGEPAQKLVLEMEDRLHQSRIKSGQKNVSWEQSQATAETMGGAYEIGQVLGKSAEDLLADWGKSTKDLAAKVEATRTLFKTAFQEAQKAAKEAVENPSPEATAKAQLAYNRWAIVQFSTGGGSSEIGRALNIHKKLARSKDMVLTKNYARVLKELGHDTLTPQAMELLATFDESNPLPGMKFLAQARKATTREKLFEIWINSLLSNPATHIVNFSSNLLFEAMSPFERAVGAGIEFIKHPTKVSKRELYFGEAAHSIVGAFHGMKEGLNRYVYAMKHGQTVSGVSKFEAPRAAIKGVTGEIIRIPTKELMANDDFFKAIIYSDDIYAQAYRMATKEGLRGDVRKARMAELIANPTEAMSEAANKVARKRTFQAELGKLGKDFMRARSRSVVLEFIFPFVRTPVNVVKEGIKRTPFGSFGTKNLTGAEHSMRYGQAVASSVVAGLVAKLVADGLVTGSAPTDKSERERLYNTGWRPYSIKIGDTYLSYGRIEPIATSLGIMADSYQVYRDMGHKEWAKLAAKIGTAFRNNITQKTFLTGMTDVINATTDPGRYGELVIKRWSTSLVPGSGLLGAITKATDPEIKDARRVVDWYKARLPGLSKQVPAKMNVMGAPLTTGGSAVSRLISPVAVSREVKDPVYQELDRLGINLGEMSTAVGGKKLSAEKARTMLQEAGPEIKKAIRELLSSPLYKAQGDENKRKMLKSWITKTRAYQKGMFVLREAR